MDAAVRRMIFNSCKPYEPVSETDPRYSDIDGQHVKARGESIVRDMANRLMLSDERRCEFFTGLPGTGKSTELRHLKTLLEDPSNGGYLVVLVDAERLLDLTTRIDVPDVLAVTAFEMERAVLAAEGKNPNAALKDGWPRRLWHWFTTTEVAVTGGSVGAEASGGIPEAVQGGVSAELEFEFKSHASLRDRLRERVKDRLPQFLNEVQGAMRELDERARVLGRGGIVVIVDSLEKLQGTTGNWSEVLDSAEALFTNDANYMKLPVHVVYTIPAALLFRLNVPVAYLPMLKLVDRDGKECPDGMAAARDLIARRIKPEHLIEMFGAATLEGRLKRLILWSGGYPREIVRLLQLCAAELRIDDDVIERLLARAGDNFRRLVSADSWPLLAQVHYTKELQPTEAGRRLVDQMLSNNIVLRYQNNTEWYDVHPSVLIARSMIEALKALRRQAAQ